jgi:hypothetical protein
MEAITGSEFEKVRKNGKFKEGLITNNAAITNMSNLLKA